MESKLNFLNNTPRGADLFEGKSQDKIATVVAQVLTDQKFQIIGLDGGWGTGKSNLVEIIGKKMPKTFFFIYDVWGHQEDDQRKAILIELTEFIVKKKIVNLKGEKWENKIKTLLSKQKEITTVNRPYLSAGFIFSLLSIVYIPTVNTFKGEGTLNFFNFILVFLPIIIVSLLYLYNVIFATKNEGWNSFKRAAEKTFQVYTNKQEEETKSETISENEPSVKDFRNWMKEIDKDLENNKLILVFDNFDRLPKKHILSIWSSIHIFFSEEKYKNVKVIIPFDRSHIKNAFKDLDSGNSNQSYANDYIDKTFDLVYRVSQPILSNWKTFFKERWVEAFGAIDENEYLMVEQIYEVYRPSITPREIIASINEIVSIKLLDNTIPDRFIMLFVLNKEVILDNPLKAIAEPEFLQGLSYLYKEDEDFQKYITALAYQIDSNDSLEVAYKKQLKDSLVNNKKDVFKEISKTKIFSKIIFSVFSEIQNFENPITVLNHLDELSQISDVELQNLWNNIFKKSATDKVENLVIPDYQKIICKHIDRKVAEKYIKDILLNLQNLDDFSSATFAKLVDSLNDYFAENNVNIDVYSILQILSIKIVEPTLFTELIDYAGKDYKKYNIGTVEEMLDAHLMNLDVNHRLHQVVADIVEDFKLEKFQKDLKLIAQNAQSNEDNLELVYNILKLFNKFELLPIIEDNSITNIFKKLNRDDEFYYMLLAMRLTRGADFYELHNTPFRSVLNDEDDSVVEKVAQNIEYFSTYSDFLLNSDTYGKLGISVAKKIILEDINRNNNGDLSLILSNFDKIINVLKIDEQSLFQDLERLEINNLKMDEISNYDISIFRIASSAESTLSLKLLELIEQKFKSVDKSGWLEILSNFDSAELNILIAVGFDSYNSFAVEAFENIMFSSIDKRNFSNLSTWTAIVEGFEKSNLSILNVLKNIRDRLYGDSTLITDELFSFLLPLFVKYKILNDRAGESFRAFFKTEFLDDAKIVGLMIEDREYIKFILSNATDDETAHFRQGIKDRIKQSRVKELNL